MTNQAAFNRIWQHFIIEEHPKGMTERGCVYYDSRSGLCCAIGCLVKDSLDEDHLNNLSGSILWLLENDQKFSSFLFDVDVKLLDLFQRAHDSSTGKCSPSSTFKEEFESRLRELSRTWKLEIPQEEVK